MLHNSLQELREKVKSLMQTRLQTVWRERERERDGGGRGGREDG